MSVSHATLRRGRLWAVVVARVAHGAKSRLSGVLNPAERRDLALAMVTDVLTTCSAYLALDGVIVVVDDPDAVSAAEAAGALAILDPHPNDMNAAVTRGLTHAAERGATSAIVLPGDIPLLSAQDLDALVSAAANADRTVVIGASRDGQGTNALLLRPVDVIIPAFGPPSVARHVGLARASGACTRVLSGLGLSLDIDTPADLSALLRRHVGAHTAAYLHSRLAVTH